MKRIIFALAAGVMVASCYTPPAAPQGMAYIYPQAQRNTLAKTFEAHVIIRELDHRPVDSEAYGGLAVTPGPHAIVVSMITHAGSTIGHMSLGRLGGSMGAAFDELHSTHFEHVLTFVAEAGHTYKACVMDTGTGYRYWIEDETARRVVAGTKLW